jgi:hypothetical protein
MISQQESKASQYEKRVSQHWEMVSQRCGITGKSINTGVYGSHTFRDVETIYSSMKYKPPFTELKNNTDNIPALLLLSQKKDVKAYAENVSVRIGTYYAVLTLV